MSCWIVIAVSCCAITYLKLREQPLQLLLDIFL